jgi:hypothetical protein
MATNLGLTRMAEACGIPYEVLHWTQEWYVREETLREANTCIVNHHHSLELARGEVSVGPTDLSTLLWDGPVPAAKPRSPV